MKVAHILPPSVLHAVKPRDYHLLLPALMPNQRYRDYYREWQTIDYLMVDNGVAEGGKIDFTHQLYMARTMNVQEVVLPDRMRDMDGTLREVASAFYKAFEYRERFRYMLVVQGQTILDCISTAERAVNLVPGIVSTFGVPRHILSQGGDARLRIVERLRNLSPNRAIHLLGTHPNLPTELYHLGDAYRRLGVRGVDTSLAWNASRSGIDLGALEVATIPRQPIDEFYDAIPTEEQLVLLAHNMGVIDSWVGNIH